jgi:hypothetical protein
MRPSILRLAFFLGIILDSIGGLAISADREFGVRGARHVEIRFTAEGQSVGSYRSGSEIRGYMQAAGIFVSFNGIDRTETVAFAVNRAGAVAGAYRDYSGRTHGFVWRYGHETSIDIPGAIDTAAFGIGESGEVVGAYRSTDCRVHGFRWTAENFSGVDADLPEAAATILTGIDNDGNITGQFSTAESPLACNEFALSGAIGAGGHAFVQRAGVATAIETAGSVDSIALGFNSANEVVGQYRTASGKVRGFSLSDAGIRSVDLDSRESAVRLGTQANWFSSIHERIP